MRLITFKPKMRPHPSVPPTPPIRQGDTRNGMAAIVAVRRSQASNTTGNDGRQQDLREAEVP